MTELNNLGTFSLQIATFVLAAAVIPWVFRMPAKFRQIYWQLVLVGCLVMPLVRGFEEQTVFVQATAATQAMVKGATVRIATGPVISFAWLLQSMLRLGLVARLLILGLGLWKLRQLRRSTLPLFPKTAWSVEADIRLSATVPGPVTFGFLNPVVVLPASFPALPEAQREAILCHEILHVRRGDWMFTIGEELVRAILWFHPAVWWVLSEIQMAREEAVDQAAIAITRSKDSYVDALLSVAGAQLQADLLPAPSFLRRRHLKQRVVKIFREAGMSKTKSITAFAASVVLLAASCWYITGALPLYGAPQIGMDGEGVVVETNGATMMHRTAIRYPAAALEKHIEGAVEVQVRTDGSGNVVDARVLSGADEFIKPVIQSVFGWHFGREAANSTKQITIRFSYPKNAPPVAGMAEAGRLQDSVAMVQLQEKAMASLTPEQREKMRAQMPMQGEPITSITIQGLSEAEATRLRAELPVHQGEPFTAEAYTRTVKALREYDEHLSVRAANRGTIIIAAPGAPSVVMPASPAASNFTPGSTPPQRVGSNVMQAALVRQPKPEYPPTAKMARVQGTVKFEVVIAKDGTVQNIHLVSGPPLLVQAAMEAVQQWAYKPTLLNGQPVEVITTVDVNFTLSQ